MTESSLAIYKIDISKSANMSAATTAIEQFLNRIPDDANEAKLLWLTIKKDAEEQCWPGSITMQTVSRWEKTVRRFETANGLTCVAVSGEVSGLAFELALAADYRVFEEGVKVFAAPVDQALWPGMGCHRLVHQIGYSNARSAIIHGKALPVELCDELGLVDEIVAKLPLEPTNAAVAVANRSRDTAVLRRLILESGYAEYESALGPHLAACARHLSYLS